MKSNTHTVTTDAAIAGIAFMSGLAVGAGMMAIFDPQKGRGRRALAGQKFRRMTRLTGEALEGSRKDLANRARGTVEAARARLRRRDEESISDEQLEARIRSRMGHFVSHPGAIDVQVIDGSAILSGAILAAEAEELIRNLRAIPGVLELEDELERYADPTHVPSLQGGLPIARRRTAFLGGGSTGLTVLAAATALYGVSRILDIDLTSFINRGASAFRPRMRSGGAMQEEEMDLDQMERTGNVPDWVEDRGSTIGLDRVR